MFICVYAGVLVNEVICAFLLDVVCMSKQPDDLVTGKRQRHEHKQGLSSGETEIETWKEVERER